MQASKQASKIKRKRKNEDTDTDNDNDNDEDTDEDKDEDKDEDEDEDKEKLDTSPGKQHAQERRNTAEWLTVRSAEFRYRRQKKPEAKSDWKQAVGPYIGFCCSRNVNSLFCGPLCVCLRCDTHRTENGRKREI